MTDDLPRRPTLLTAAHAIATFDCGEPDLNEFLNRFALGSQRSGKSRTYVATLEQRVVGYYSLAPASVGAARVPSRVATGQGSQDIPVVLIGRLAVDREHQGHGLGSQMLLDALLRANQGAEIIGGRAVLVHSKVAGANDFYTRHGFEVSPVSPQHLMILLKDVRKTLGL